MRFSISTSCCASGRTVSYGRTRLDSELPRDDKPFTRLVGTVVPGKGATTAKKVLPSPLRCRSQATPYTAYNPPNHRCHRNSLKLKENNQKIERVTKFQTVLYCLKNEHSPPRATAQGPRVYKCGLRFVSFLTRLRFRPHSRTIAKQITSFARVTDKATVEKCPRPSPRDSCYRALSQAPHQLAQVSLSATALPPEPDKSKDTHSLSMHGYGQRPPRHAAQGAGPACAGPHGL